MSEENVDVVRRVYVAAGRRDSDAIFALYDSEVELDATRLGLADLDVSRACWASGTVPRVLRDLGRDRDSYDELIDAGEQVIAIVTRHARGRASGAEVERPFALAWTVR
jgi:ketosteroid isomerase-like protein